MSSLQSATAHLVVSRDKKHGADRSSLQDRDDYRSFVTERRPTQNGTPSMLTEWAKKQIPQRIKR